MDGRHPREQPKDEKPSTICCSGSKARFFQKKDPFHYNARRRLEHERLSGICDPYTSSPPSNQAPCRGCRSLIDEGHHAVAYCRISSGSIPTQNPYLVSPATEYYNVAQYQINTKTHRNANNSKLEVNQHEAVYDSFKDGHDKATMPANYMSGPGAQGILFKQDDRRNRKKHNVRQHVRNQRRLRAHQNWGHSDLINMSDSQDQAIGSIRGTGEPQVGTYFELDGSKDEPVARTALAHHHYNQDRGFRDGDKKRDEVDSNDNHDDDADDGDADDDDYSIIHTPTASDHEENIKMWNQSAKLSLQDRFLRLFWL